MKKKIFLIYILIYIFSFAGDKTIALVLAGGGAKGFAHLGLMKVLEEEEVPIDYIVGTSMGSILGALYAMGYTPMEIEEIILDKKWMKYFDERISREDMSVEKKFYKDRFLMFFPFNNFNLELPQGALKGQNLENLFNELYIDAQTTSDFNDLPIKFASIATNVETGEKVVLNKGSLPKVVRASMAIPSVFTPVKIDGKLLIDGMSASNFPVEVAKEMGADIIIGSDLIITLKKENELKTLLDVLRQTNNFPMIKESSKKEIISDILIIPKLDRYNPMDFPKAKEIIAIGEEAAREKIDEIRKYSNSKKFAELKAKRLPKVEGAYINKISIIGNERYDDDAIKNMMSVQFPAVLLKEEITELVENIYGLGYFDKVSYTLKGNELEICVKEIHKDEVKLGFNYNTVDFGELYVNATRRGLGEFSNELNLDFVLAKDRFVRFRSKKYIGVLNKLVFEFSAEQNTFTQYDFYQNGKRVGASEINLGNIGFNFGTSFGKNNSLYTGLRRHHFSIKDLYEIKIMEESFTENLYNDYYLKYTYDSLDSLYFSKKGNYLKLELSASNKSISDYEFIKYRIKSETNFSLAEKMILKLGFNGELLEDENELFILKPSLGGFQNRKNSLELWGYDVSQYYSDKIGTIYSELNYEFTNSKYVIFRYNMATFETEDSHRSLGGIGLGIGAKTLLGPVKFIVASSEKNATIMYLNIGYYF